MAKRDTSPELHTSDEVGRGLRSKLRHENEVSVPFCRMVGHQSFMAVESPDRSSHGGSNISHCTKVHINERDTITRPPAFQDDERFSATDGALHIHHTDASRDPSTVVDISKLEIQHTSSNHDVPQASEAHTPRSAPSRRKSNGGGSNSFQRLGSDDLDGAKHENYAMKTMPCSEPSLPNWNGSFHACNPDNSKRRESNHMMYQQARGIARAACQTAGDATSMLL